MTIEEAFIYCENLILGGFSNWRLPNTHEAYSILNNQQSNPASDPLVFSINDTEYWWTGNYQIGDHTKVWATNAGGRIGNHPKSETISAGGIKKIHVRAVRDINTFSTIPFQFTDNSDGTITDNLTDLNWIQIPSTDSLTWEEALIYAEELAFNNSTNWRLPNIKELQSINEVGISNPSINTSFFTVSSNQKYWSSKSLPNQTSEAWFLDSQFGVTSHDSKTLKHAVICVKDDNLNTSLLNNLDRTVSLLHLKQNPVNDVLIIECITLSHMIGLLMIFNSLNEKVNETNLHSLNSETNKISFDTNNLCSGMYYYKLILDDGINLINKSGKLIVSH